jgi:2-oxo-4-hydroxy-4-carboxy-5-ureidoimidazoline decarboxylase
MTTPPLPVAGLDALDPRAAASALRPCCASRAWLDALVGGRPYRDLVTLTAAAESALVALDWPAVLEALDAHPRIGERAAGSGTEARWSRGEQSTAAGADQRVLAELHAGNVAYEQRFGHVFLICATGRSAPEIMAELTDRLDHDFDQEQAVVRAELQAIVRLRLAKAFC